MKIATFVALSVAAGVFATPAPQILAPTLTICAPGEITRNAQICCKWFKIGKEVQNELFNGGQCAKGARRVLQDSLVASKLITETMQLTSTHISGGGADGSIIAHSNIETTFVPNRALGPTIEALRKIAIRNSVSFGDILNFANAMGLSNCPGAPRLQFLAGKSNSSQPSPPGLIPGPGNDVNTILNRMADAGFSASDTVDLLSAHTMASQEALNLNPAAARAPFDSTPAIFDSQFFIETLLKGRFFTPGGPGFGEVTSPLPGEFRMQSDFTIARDPRTSCRWQSMMADSNLMATRFRAAAAKLSVLGFEPKALTDCSDVIPTRVSIVRAPHIPAGLTNSDVEGFCAGTLPPNFPVAAGPLQTVAPALP
ncbi:heme peroxidase [Coprinopsis marcescibilis]|uniref:Peroxidase n=1 Tax=Coprinopsis marcescibilis TaxID=230819 RepID=A0A5C3L3H5_COPMA|nr:heme peroxidase [Coprinopsis marcescibilis]